MREAGPCEAPLFYWPTLYAVMDSDGSIDFCNRTLLLDLPVRQTSTEVRGVFREVEWQPRPGPSLPTRFGYWLSDVAIGVVGVAIVFTTMLGFLLGLLVIGTLL